MTSKKKEIRLKCLKSYLTSDEHETIKQLAKETGLSISDYTRRIITGHRIESRIDQTAFLSALKLNADLGRLGGLFKLYISEGFQKVSPEEVRRVLREIEDRQRQLMPIIKKIRELV